MTTPAAPAPAGAVPDGVLLFQHPGHPEVFAVYPNGLRIHVPWVLWNAWGAPRSAVILMNTANGSADADYAGFMAYDRALQA